MKKYGRTRKAIEETIRICINEDILVDYLKEREVEVMDIMTTLFDEEVVFDRYVTNKVNKAEKENAKKIALNMLKNGKMSIEEIAECAGLSVAEVEKIANLELV